MVFLLNNRFKNYHFIRKFGMYKVLKFACMLHFKRSKSNSFLTITDLWGNVLKTKSGGIETIYGNSKRMKLTFKTTRTILFSIGKLVRRLKKHYIYVHISRKYKKLLRTMVVSLRKKKILILAINLKVDAIFGKHLRRNKVRRR